MTTVDIDHLLRNDELLQLLDGAEQAGSLKSTEVADVVETHELDALEQDALYRELDRRGIEIIADEPKDEEPPPAPAPVVPQVLITRSARKKVVWTKDQLKQPFALETVGQTDTASYHVIRLTQAQQLTPKQPQ